ncbi:chromosome condensation protein [Arthrobacter sp. MYb224]|nr:chromosome condensation protein [Arthrobacter sp. MYb224]PRB48403.1 chromosome condensation protein [Arthrobacter sp. MYb216]
MADLGSRTVIRRETVYRLFAVAIGGALGAYVRVGVDMLLPANEWAASTLLVNVLGSTALAGLSAYGARRPLNPLLQLAAGTGFCGAFTTLSTVLLLFTAMSATGYLGYLALTVALCLAAVFTTHRVILRLVPASEGRP